MTTFDNNAHQLVFLTGPTLQGAERVPASEMILKALHQLELASRVSISEVEPDDVTKLWLDKRSFPDTLRIYNSGTSEWDVVTAGDEALGVLLGAGLVGADLLTADTEASARTKIGLQNADILGRTYVPSATGGIARTLRSKIEEGWVTPFDFGAVGNGINDDTAAVQAGIDASAATGHSLVIPPGTFLCTDTLDLASGARLRGGGDRDQCILKLLTNDSSVHFLDGNGVSNVTIENLTVDGGRSATLVTGSAIRLRAASSYCTISRVSVINSPREHVLIRDGSHHITVEFCEFDEKAAGAGHVYLLTNVSDCQILHNTMAGGEGGCIWLSGACHRNIISGNRNTGRTDSELIGIRWDCDYGVISNNYVDSTGDNGISVTGSGWSVFGNVCKNSDFAGIGVYGSNNTVFGNVLFDNGRIGNSVHGGLRVHGAYGGLGSNNIIFGNKIFRIDGAADEQYYGIRIDSTSYQGWSAGLAVVSGDFYHYQNKLYRADTTATTGATPPTHTSGTVSDGVVDWYYAGAFNHRLTRAGGNRFFGNSIGEHEGGAYYRASGSSSDFADEALRSQSVSASAGWTTGTEYSAGDIRNREVNGVKQIYRATTGGTSGATPPTHTSGTASDGGVTWLYVGDGPSLEVFELSYSKSVVSVPFLIQQIDSSSSTGPGIYAGGMTPEDNVEALNGSIYLRNNGTYGIQAYIKTGGISRTGWIPIAYRDHGVTANRPSAGSGATGAAYFDETLGKPIWWDGAEWVEATGETAGSAPGTMTAARYVSEETIVVADDAAFSRASPVAAGFGIVGTTGADERALFDYRTSGTASLRFYVPDAGIGAVMLKTTGVLSGTTGTDAKITVSAHTDGNVYVENRRGASRTFTLTWLG